MTMLQELKQKAFEMEKELIDCRRDFHRYAEPGWLEMRTASIVASRLKSLGYEVLTGRDVCLEGERMGLPSDEVQAEHYAWACANGADPEFVGQMKDSFTGVIGVLRCGEGPTVALRYEMDALTIKEREDEGHRPVREGFASCTPGVMHACGHDGHTTIGLGTAKMLSEMKDWLHGTVKLIFQPAEEGLRGGRSIVAHGHLDDVDYILACHLSNSPDTECHIAPGMSGTLPSAKIDATFHGKGAHSGIAPQEGHNALLSAATAVLNLHAIPRHGGGISRVNVGTLHAGSMRNVVCDTAKLEIEVRGENTEVNDYMEQYARNVLEGAALMHGCTVEIERMGMAGAVVSNPDFVEQVKKICTEHLGLDVRTPGDMGASEDFAHMSNRVVNLGGKCCFSALMTPCAAAFHDNGFDFDEQALPYGVYYFSGMVWSLIGKEE